MLEAVDRGTVEAELTAFLYDYAETLDEFRYTDWCDLFVDAGVYSITTHSNADTGLMLYLDRGRHALRERAAYLAGYYRMARTKTLHMISNVRVKEWDGARASLRSYFVLYKVGKDGVSRFHVSGEYHDTLVRPEDDWRFEVHHVVLDGDTMPADMTDLL